MSGHYDRQDALVDGWSATSASAYSPYYAGEARGWGLASNNSLSGYTSISSDHGNGVISADGGSGRWGTFIVSGNGNITLQVNYSLLLDLQRCTVDGGYSYADPDARIRLDNYSDSAYVFDNDDLNQQYFGIGTTSDNKSGTLKLTLAFADGETGKFSAAAYGGVSEVFAVPEAFSLALLLFGLVGLAGVKRKIR